MAGIGATTRVDDGNWIPGYTVVSTTGGLGALAQNIPSIGTDGPSPLYSSLEFPADTDAEVRWTQESALTNGGVLTLGELGEMAYVGPADSASFQYWRQGLKVDTPKTVTFAATGAPTTTLVSSDLSCSIDIAAAVRSDLQVITTLESATVQINAAPSRRVVFEGGKRKVPFEGGKRKVVF